MGVLREGTARNDGFGTEGGIGFLPTHTLAGGAGHDPCRLCSSPHHDKRFPSPLPSPGDGADRVLDVVAGEDRIEISAAGFGGGLLPDMSLAGRFFGPTLPPGTGPGAFNRNQATGQPVWDAHGSLAGGRSLIAVLDPGTSLAATDVIVIA